MGYSQVRLTKCLYNVDKQITVQLNKFGSAEAGRLAGSMKIKVPWNEGTLFDQTLDCFTKAYLKNDTIYITGNMIGELGYGFHLILFKDSCIVAPFGLSDGKIYKYSKSDANSIDFIPLPTKAQKVTLSKNPTYKEGDTVEGFVDLKSQPFYYTDLDGVFKIELQAYFKTEPLKKK